MTNVMPIRPDAVLRESVQEQDRGQLGKRLEDEEERVCRAFDIVALVVEVLDGREDDHSLWGSLLTAKSMLGDVISGLASARNSLGPT